MSQPSNKILQKADFNPKIRSYFLSFIDLRILKIETAGQSNPQGSDMKQKSI